MQYQQLLLFILDIDQQIRWLNASDAMLSKKKAVLQVDKVSIIVILERDFCYINKLIGKPLF